jgi:hypothetical protein
MQPASVKNQSDRPSSHRKINFLAPHRGWLIRVAVLAAILVVTVSSFVNGLSNSLGGERAIAQSPSPTESPSPAPSPTLAPAIPGSSAPIPQISIPPAASPSPAAPASTAPPAELSGTYTDPANRFKVGILKGYKASPLAGSVLIEANDGQLAYAVVPQSQPLGNPIGLSLGYDNSESLAKVALSALQRGEGFQPGPPRTEAGGGAILDWTGSLTLGGNSQPVGGVVLMRPSSKTILLLIVTATQPGANRIPTAVSALANSLEAL